MLTGANLQHRMFWKHILPGFTVIKIFHMELQIHLTVQTTLSVSSSNFPVLFHTVQRTVFLFLCKSTLQWRRLKHCSYWTQEHQKPLAEANSKETPLKSKRKTHSKITDVLSAKIKPRFALSWSLVIFLYFCMERGLPHNVLDSCMN